MLCTSLSSSSSTLHRLIPLTCKPPAPAPPRIGVERILQLGSGKTSRRGISVVTRGAPSAGSYIFAFVFPLSLLAVTIFTSVRIADKLDQKFLEEIAVNGVIPEAQENGEEVLVSSEEESTPVRTRNRPKRQVESSSM